MPKQPLIQLTTRISAELDQALADYAAKHGLTKRKVIIAALEVYLKDNK